MAFYGTDCLIFKVISKLQVDVAGAAKCGQAEAGEVVGRGMDKNLYF